MEMQDGFADEADTGVDLLVTLGFGVGAAADSDAEVVGELCGRRVGDAGDGAGVGGLPGVGAEQQSLGLSGVELGAAGGGEDGDGPRDDLVAVGGGGGVDGGVVGVHVTEGGGAAEGEGDGLHRAFCFSRHYIPGPSMHGHE